MKTIFTLLLSSLFSMAVMANHNVRLSVSTITKNSSLVVEVDGHHRYDLDHQTITVRDLAPGYHHIKIYREKKRGNGRFGFGNKREMIYNSRVLLRDGFHTDLIISRTGKVFIDEQWIDRNNPWYDDDDDYFDPRDRDFNRAMTDHEFTMVKEALRKEWFENNRATSAKQVIDGNFMTSEQVKQMLQLFTFENHKLDLAKYAYGKTVDQRNYFIVNDVFMFSSSKDELARYIRNR